MTARRLLVAALLALALVLGGCAQAPIGQVPRGELVQRTIVAGHALAYCASAPIEDWSPTVRRVFVAVHGLDRNACGMRRAVLDALGGEGGTTMVVAPHFAAASDAQPGGHAWNRNGWPAGDASTAGVSSYEVLDALIARLGTREVILVGFSGGGQLTNRYAAISPHAVDRYVVVNPSSYVWFSADRPVPAASCPGADEWRYGLAGRRGYVAWADAATVRAQYAAREVHYLIGTADDDPRSAGLDRSCAAMTQGANREERALNYHRHLLATFGEGIASRQPLALVPGVGHDAAGMLNSRPGREALLG